MSTSARVTIPVAETVSDLKIAQSASATMTPIVAAILAPPTGSTGLPAGTPVVTVTQSFWEHPTVRALRALVVSVFTAALLVSLLMIQSAGALDRVNWDAVLFAFENAFVIGLAGALAAWLTKRNNNPVASVLLVMCVAGGVLV